MACVVIAHAVGSKRVAPRGIRRPTFARGAGATPPRSRVDGDARQHRCVGCRTRRMSMPWAP
eukprot:1448984-Pyramimonas_sp.AAC.1